MVRFMGAGSDTIDAETDYFSVLMIGFLPTALPLAIYTITITGLGTDIFATHQIVLTILNRPS